jgi:YbgC/YbaW family acyl-CoA thioester hydrolase
VSTAHEFRHRRIVEFAETDMAGILHFANYFRWMEAAEHAFFRSLGLCVHTDAADGPFGFARGHAECTFQAPLRYEDRVELHLRVREIRRTSIRYEIVFRRLGDDGAPAEDVARGSLTAVCVARPKGETRMRAIDIPAAVRARVGVAPS